MGSIEFIRLNTGERTTIEADGTMIKDQIDPPILDWCDKCESWKTARGGQYQDGNQIPILWFCETCK